MSHKIEAIKPIPFEIFVREESRNRKSNGYEKFGNKLMKELSKKKKKRN